MKREYLYLAGAMAIAGSAMVVSKMMVSALPTFLAAGLGVACGLLCLIPACFVLRHEKMLWDGRTHLVLLGQALCGVLLYRVFTFWGLRYTSAVDSGLISSGGPVFVAILALVFLKDRPTKNRMTGVLLVSVGLLAVNLMPILTQQQAWAKGSSVRGNLLILAAVFSESVFSVLSRVRCKPMSALYRTTMITGYAFFLLLPVAIYDGYRYNWAEFGVSSAICMLYYGVFVSFLSYILWFRGIAKVPASGAAVFTGVAPISSMILSALLLRERVMPVHLAGLLFICVGILVSCIDVQKQGAAESSTPKL